MNCSPGATWWLYTGKGLAVAWDNRHNRTVVAWANQTRMDDPQDREIWLTVGHIDYTTLPQPAALGIRTSVPPAVACNAYSAGGYDCLLAHTEQNDSLNKLRIRRFFSISGTHRYEVYLDPQAYEVGVRTASPVALWYSAGGWYLAVRPIHPWGGQELELWASNDGSNWFHLGPVAYSAVGPSAVSYWQGADNALVYAR